MGGESGSGGGGSAESSGGGGDSGGSDVGGNGGEAGSGGGDAPQPEGSGEAPQPEGSGEAAQPEGDTPPPEASDQEQPEGDTPQPDDSSEAPQPEGSGEAQPEGDTPPPEASDQEQPEGEAPQPDDSSEDPPDGDAPQPDDSSEDPPEGDAAEPEGSADEQPTDGSDQEQPEGDTPQPDDSSEAPQPEDSDEETQSEGDTPASDQEQPEGDTPQPDDSGEDPPEGDAPEPEGTDDEQQPEGSDQAQPEESGEGQPQGDTSQPDDSSEAPEPEGSDEAAQPEGDTPPSEASDQEQPEGEAPQPDDSSEDPPDGDAPEPEGTDDEQQPEGSDQAQPEGDEAQPEGSAPQPEDAQGESNQAQEGPQTEPAQGTRNPEGEGAQPEAQADTAPPPPDPPESTQPPEPPEPLGDQNEAGEQGRNEIPKNDCTTVGHPVDVATGKVFTDAVDLELPGPLLFRFERTWFSTSTYAGPLGHGWHHSYDDRMLQAPDGLTYLTSDGRSCSLPLLGVGESHFDRRERFTVVRDQAAYRVTDARGVSRRYAHVGEDGEQAANPRPFRLDEIVNRAGQRISFAYLDGRLAEIRDSGGRLLRMAYNEAGRITALSAPHPQRAGERFDVARYAYDQAGNLASVTDALDRAFSYVYRGHLLVQETNRVGLSFHFEYDADDETARCPHTWGDGGIYENRLTFQPGETIVVNSLGHTTRYEHDQGLVTGTVDALGARRRTRFEFRQPVEEVDPLGRVTTFTYDARGNLVESVAPDGARIRTRFDERDLPVEAVDAIGGRWSWEYDESGLLVGRRDPLGATTEFTYRSGLMATVTDPAGGVVTLDHDVQGSLAGLTTPDGARRGWRRNALGWAVATIDPLGNERRVDFDLSGRAVQVNEPDGNRRDLEYDGEGNLVHAVDRLTDVRFDYAGRGWLASRSQAGTTVRFDHDTQGRLTGVVNEHGHAHTFELGPVGEVLVESGFDGVRRRYEHDVAGRVTAVRRASGIVSRYRYDLKDRVVAVEHSDGTGERFTYRADGAVLAATNATCEVTFERDPLGRVLREAQDGRWVAGEHDALGLRARMTSSLGADVAIERDVVGGVSRVRAEGFDARFERDRLGQELARSLPGGVQARWHRDELGRPVRHEVTSVGGGVVRDRGYTWDVDGQLREVLDALTGPIQYVHDGLGQLVSATRPDGTVDLRMPDAVGNLFHREDRDDRRYGPAGQLLEAMHADGRVVRYEYDPEGNLISKEASDGETWTYRWNADGYLADVVRPDGALVSFTYDALGRRVSKTYLGRTTRWVWDGDVPLHEWVDGEAPPITWLFEPESFAPLARLAEHGHESIVTDHLGTPVALLDSDGASSWAGELGVWGDLEPRIGDPAGCPFRWPGQYEDLETGLAYSRHRYYAADDGQFISRDPLRISGGMNVYAYPGDPLGSSDPYGLAEINNVLSSGTVYRSGGDTMRNYTPRPIEKDLEGHKRGLSAWQEPEQAGNPGQNVQAIDVARLGPGLEAVHNDTNGHVSIRPTDDPNNEKLADWANARAGDGIGDHDLSRQVAGARVGSEKIPKSNC